jgi:hypothetical protein
MSKKISELPAQAPIKDTDLIPVVDKTLANTNAQNRRVTFLQVKENILANVPENAASFPAQDGTTADKALFSTGVEGAEEWRQARSLLAWEDTFSIQPVDTIKVLKDAAGVIDYVRKDTNITDFKVQINGGAQTTLTFSANVWTGLISFAAGAVITFIPTSAAAYALFIVKGQDN